MLFEGDDAEFESELAGMTLETDFVDSDGRLDMQRVMSMPTDNRHAMMEQIMGAAAQSPDAVAADAMPDSQPQVIARGMFRDADAIHKGTGTALLYALADGRNIVRFEDFRTTNGPALVVYIAKHPSPTAASDVTEGGFLSLGKLKGKVDNQNYAVPAEIDIAEYGSVVVWCELFGVLFSPAALERVET